MRNQLSLVFTLILTISMGIVNAGAPPVFKWQKCYGGTVQDIPGGVIKTHDGSIVLLGNVDSQNGDITGNHGSTDIWLTKTDSVGNIIWRKTFGGTSIDVGISVIELANGKFLIAGYSSSADGDFPNNKGAFDVLLICADANGNMLWYKNYGGTAVDLCYTMIQAADGSFILAGASYSSDVDLTINRGAQDMWIFKVDVNGNLLWQLSAGGSQTEIGYALAQDSAGNIYCAGTASSHDGNISYLHGNNDFWVVKVSNSGQLIWNKTYGGTEYETAQCILIDDRQQILIGGYTRSDDQDITLNQGFGDCWLIKINQQGNLLFQKTFGGTGAENLYTILQTSDEGYILACGSTSDDFDIKNTKGFEDVWLLKLDSQFAIDWSRNYGGTGSDRPVRFINDNDGGYLLAAYTFSNNGDVIGQHGIADIWIVDFGCFSPTASFIATSSNCLHDTINLQNTSVNASGYQWSVNNHFYSDSASVNIPLNVTGNYHIELSAAMCSNKSTHAIDVMVIDCSLPMVSINANSNTVCTNATVTFADLSSNTTSWQWMFPGGNPSSSTQQNPVVTYSQPGTYSVMLTASNSYGSQSVMRYNYITVDAAPVTPVITVSGNILTSTNAYSYEWYYNNSLLPNSNSRQINATFDGYYSVKVFSAGGCSLVSQPVYYSINGIRETSIEHIRVFPNPTNGPFQVEFPAGSDGSVSIYDMSGREIEKRKIIPNQTRLALSLASYSDGIYMLVYTGSNKESKQFKINKY
jgi:PKD repeat protein